MSSAQSQSVAESNASKPSVLPEDMSIAEVMRIMDVASTLRREQEIVDREFNLDQTKELLREKLRTTAELTGETLTPEQVEAAVNWYYDNLHEYKEPERSPTWYLAHLYVRRKAILSIFVPIALAIGAIWSLWFAPFAPFSAANKLKQQLNAANTKIEKRYKSIMSIAQSDDIKSEATQLQKEAQTYFENREVEGLNKIQARLSNMDSRLNEEFVLTVVSGENQRSATRRDFTDNTGTRISGFYLIVQARDQNGNLIKRRIQDVESDKFKMVDTWGEKVPESVYERLKKDKTEDGILNETKFGNKIRGHLNVKILMPGADGKPIERGGQITQW